MITHVLSVSSLKELFSYWPFVAAFIGNGYFFVIATTILTLCLIGVCLLVKYVPNVLNDLKTSTNNELSSVGISLWIALILALPVFFDAGPLWFVLWWFIILWGYLTIFERRIAYVFISLIFMSSWIAHLGGGFLTYAETGMNKEIFLIHQGIGSLEDSLAISSWAGKNPADAEPINTLAVIEMTKKNNKSAVTLLSRALDLEPGNNRYYNNLGIALAGINMNDRAIKAFQNAVALDNGNVVYHYNLSRLFQATYNFFEAERSIRKASGINSAKIRDLLDKETNIGGKKYIMEAVPLQEQLARQMKPSSELSLAADQLWHLFFGVVKRNRAIYVSIAVVLIIFFLRHIPEEKFSKRCNRCGKLYYAGTTSKSGYPMCLQCHWIETKPKKQMNIILANKADEIKSYRLISSSYSQKLEIILPGLGSFMVNKPLKAVLRLAVLSASLILMLTGCRFLYSFVPSGIDLIWHMRIAGVLLAGFLYWRSYKSPPLKYGI